MAHTFYSHSTTGVNEFPPQIQRIVARIPRERQTLFFSATWPREVKAIASQFVTRATVHVFVGAVEDKVGRVTGQHRFHLLF